MTEAIAYRLKQIMTANHMSLTQAAKLIGTSPTSLRKIIAGNDLSQPIMFKVNRFIDAHPEAFNQRHTFTIAESSDSTTTAKPKAASAASAGNQPAGSSGKKAQSSAAKAGSIATKTGAQAAGKSAAKTAKTESANNAKADQKKNAQKTGAKNEKNARAAQSAKSNPAKKADKQTVSSTASSQAAKPAASMTKAQSKAAAAKKAQSSAAGSAKAAASSQAAKSAASAAKASAAAAKAKSEADSLAASKAANLAKAASLAAKSEARAAAKAAARSGNASKPAEPTAATAEASSGAASKLAAQSSAAQPATSVAASATVAQSSSASSAAESQPLQLAAPQLPATNGTTIQIFMDESFGHGDDYQRAMSIGAIVVNPDDEHALDAFTKTLYPFGWQPGDEVKARGKSPEAIVTMLQNAGSSAAQTYSIYSALSDTGNFALGFGVLYPYLAAILRILGQLPALPAKVRVALDKRNEISDEKLGMAARMLHAYIQAETGLDVLFLLRTTDSKDTIGVQYSDFVGHAAMTLSPVQLADAGVVRLPEIGAQTGDQVTLYAMVGLQKYLLDDRPQRETPTGYKNPVLAMADRLFVLASRAAAMTTVADEALSQAKLILNQLLQMTPSSVNGAINKMPFQNWYDIVARAASLLHYTDSTLPQFSINADAMQIATDALNNVATLVAGGH